MNAFLRAAQRRADAEREARILNTPAHALVKGGTDGERQLWRREELRLEMEERMPEVRRRFPHVPESTLKAIVRREARREMRETDRDANAAMRAEAAAIATAKARGLVGKAAADALGMTLKEFEAAQTRARRAGLI